MWKQIEKPKTVAVTKSLAAEFYNMETLPRDRPLSERRILVYQRILANHEFRPVTWASAYCKETDSVYRVNGKHTSTMIFGIAENGGDLPKDFYVTIERYECDTMEDVAKLYSTFDSALSSRTANDIIQSFASTAKELKEVAKKTFGLVVAAASFDKWGLHYHSRPAAERAELLLDNIDFAIWANDILFPSEATGQKQRDGAHIWRAAIVAAMYSTWKKAKSDSEKFWIEVRDESGIHGSPSRALAKFLVRSQARTIMKSAKETVTFKEMYVKSIHAWNAFRKGSTTDLKYYSNAKLPAAV